MFVSTLKNNFQTSIVLMVSFSFLVWGFSFHYTETPILGAYHHILYDAFFSNIKNGLVEKLTVLISILLGAFMVNALAINQEIIDKNNFLPAFIYIMFGFSSSTNGYIEPALIANLLVLPALYFILESYRQEGQLKTFYNVGLFLGLASFFFTFYVFLFPIAYIALLITRTFNWREWLVLFFGLMTPIYFYCGWSYLNHQGMFAIGNVLFENLRGNQQSVFSEYYIVFLFFIGFAFLLAVFHNLTKGFGNKIKTTKSKYILLWILLSGLLISFYKQDSAMMFLPFIIPFSILIGDYLANIKQLKIANTLLFLIISGFAIVIAHAIGAI